MSRKYTEAQVISALKAALAKSESQRALADALKIQPQQITMGLRGYLTPALASALGFEPVERMYQRRKVRK